MKTGALIVAGGLGLRMHSSLPKQFMPLSGKEIFVRSVEVFHGSAFVDFIVLVVHKDWLGQARKILEKRGMDSVSVVSGGETRQESVQNGLLFCETIKPDIVMIHDAARPFFSKKQIPEILRLVTPGTGVVVTEKTADTVYLVEDEVVVDVPNRSNLRRAETPQTFKFQEILQAHRKAVTDGIHISTDDAQLFVGFGGRVLTVDSIVPNPKITTPLDFEMAELMIEREANFTGRD
ncbi:2-C-methyl-D-erythritol 4-phosphate cytidylyltransferase [Mesotoga sp. BH458_6_3_2_1]|uniref:2-C-methyl-D-erythritol 4-phosphate cytidylyltransferase n=1 Tax=Mesotoga sp. BH458_6_3_2_1 TaxID=1437446 RepID=UPI000EF274E5|nr:2-C-methyl-D-erythritol 4-phosphate cytidylyltransferase [Mesotoga sp. BH458_6_3_2_1]RLL84717.1 2-C-methyl-D-erythritol 4-phosphate cytidylyltransferase [Mesotoga sp. BH458_6_3_2_1]